MRVSFRLVGFLASVPMVAGCLAPAPSYDAPQQIPPTIIESRVEPPLDAILELQDNQSMVFVAPFLSEDLGETVVARVYIDVKPGERLGASQLTDVVPPGTLEDRSRSLQGTIPADELGEPGCHSVTLIAAHESQFGSNRDPNEEQVDRITWWVHLPGTSGREVLLKDCVTGREAEQ